MLVVSSPLALVSAGAVLIAGAAFIATAPEKEQPEVDLISAPYIVEPQLELTRNPELDQAQRRDTYVVVFNNSGITGLAAGVSERLAGAGWNVVGSDNWYGTIPETTVYYPPELRSQADLLAGDLGIARVVPSVEPMQMDRLTVILTTELPE
ncbi:MAG: LytR C-terminal domain-containing protein [Nocardioidaceae bacterium]|nr:MAG: LytR C-terminal domain-containing protein [Nocardioidaceae bacterium]